MYFLVADEIIDKGTSISLIGKEETEVRRKISDSEELALQYQKIVSQSKIHNAEIRNFINHFHLYRGLSPTTFHQK